MFFAFVFVSLTLLVFNACVIANGTKLQLNKFSQLQFAFPVVCVLTARAALHFLFVCCWFVGK